ncbi:unnamed protein product [Cylindrotheca closterium]|uniref:HMG box domain-containing protein n=1 Tax=Cylindrotheca closterium TaxID=2856 RepID=A0AAD2FBE8_9STRA|nr:unnamed protein product [Cylindrotheca closterium]
MADAVAAMAQSASNGSQKNGFSSTAALVSYLRSEADQAEKKAKQLREQASNLARQFGITEADQSAYEYPSHMAPLDENGVPKYKGKKRGRKPKVRKRKVNPNRRKRQHTAYTLFVQETYPIIKSAYPDYASKDVISIVAKQWKNELSEGEKGQWRARALETHGQDEEDETAEAASTNAAAPPPAPINAQHDEAVVAAAAAAAAEDDDDDDDEALMHEEDEDDMEDDGVEVEEEAETEDESSAGHARRSKRGRKK